jgi:PKD repeat protein
MTDEKGALSIDFLVGFTIFLLGFIWVISMIPGLLIGLQAYTVDYDAVAYRTSVILVEDPGEPALPLAVQPWEYLNDPRDVVRFGLAISKDTPNILSQDKVNRFFCSTAFSYPRDYQNKTIFGNYPYQFNISILDPGRNTTLTVGDAMSPNSSYGTIRRLVKIKGSSSATINSTRVSSSGTPYFIHGVNESQHEFTILFNNTELLTGQVRDPIYQIDPAKENILINITNINSTLGTREPCFNITLSKRITVFSQDPNTNTFYTIGYFDTPVIDGIQYNLSLPPPYGVRNNISMMLNPRFIPWSNYKQVYVSLDFDLIGNGACNFTGSQFLNNSISSPFDYNYDQKNVTQPNLRDAVLEVNIGSGYRTITETIIQLLKAQFGWDTPASRTITFRDQSLGSPVSWEWNLGDGAPNGTTSIVTHPYALPGIYTVALTVTDNNGVSDSISHQIDLSAPVAGFSGSPVSGPSPLDVQFTDASTAGGAPIISRVWEYNKTVAGSWTQFSTAPNPFITFTNGTYDIRLTATNIFGNNTFVRPAYITAIPIAPVASFSTTPSPATGNAPLLVTFTDTSTGGTPDTWDWDFGDGSPHSNVQNPTHTYTVPGSYTAQLTVSNAGGSSSATQPVSIGLATPHIVRFNLSGTWTAPAGVTSVEYLVVGGGAGGGSYGGGGGAGGFRTASGYAVTPGNTYIVTVGAGGAGGTGGNRGTNGGNSVFAGITSTGGGGGGGSNNNDGINGGSGGGARSTGTVGTGNIPVVSPSQGNNGGRGGGSSGNRIGGGGGGALAVGGDSSGTICGSGGAGATSLISGVSVTYAGGGGGGGNSGNTRGNGGAGGGGNGSTTGTGSNGAQYTGGGGGGGGNGFNGGQGGSGIVIIMYMA